MTGRRIVLHGTEEAHEALDAWLRQASSGPSDWTSLEVEDHDRPWDDYFVATALCCAGSTMVLPDLVAAPDADRETTLKRLHEAERRIEPNDVVVNDDRPEIIDECWMIAQIGHACMRVVQPELLDRCLNETVIQGVKHVCWEVGMEIDGSPIIWLEGGGGCRRIDIGRSGLELIAAETPMRFHLAVVDPMRDLRAGDLPAPNLLVAPLLGQEQGKPVETTESDHLDILRIVARYGADAAAVAED